MKRTILAAIALTLLIQPLLTAQEPPVAFSMPGIDAPLPLVFWEDFEGMSAEWWTFSDEKAWQVVAEDGGSKVLDLFGKSDYKPPVRSPRNFALVDGLMVSDFILEARLKQTGEEYGHRDLCLFFGRQDPAHFYYVHIASQADDYANSIFIVNGEPRTSIAKERTGGTKWGTGYHTVRLVRNTSTGLIAVYFDDMSTPIMVAEDTTFAEGSLGLGSFDDVGRFDDVKVWAKVANTSRLKAVDLPDFGTPDAGVVLDLATGAMLPAGDFQTNKEYFIDLGQGDLFYDLVRLEEGNDSPCLVFPRGTQAEHTAEDGQSISMMDVVKALDSGTLPWSCKVTTPEKKKFLVRVLSAGKDRARIVYGAAE